MSAVTHLLRPDDPAWDEWIARVPHSFHHRAAYHLFAEAEGEGQAHLVVHIDGDRFLAWPYLIRPIGGGGRDATSVYGYSGPVGALGRDDRSFAHAAWMAFRQIWADQQLLTMFTRFHPLLDNASFGREFHGTDQAHGDELVVIGRTVSIDLDLDRDQRLAQYHKELRYEVRRARRKGVRVESDPEWSQVDALARLYDETMDRNDADERYRLSRGYFDGLRRALGSRASLATAVVGDEVAAILLYVVHGDIAEAHLTGVDYRFRALSPLKAVLDATADLCRNRGARVLHIGAGRGGFEDSLFDFKRRFSPRRHDFVLGRWVLDTAGYARKCDSSGLTSPTAGRPSFFPCYRSPGASTS